MKKNFAETLKEMRIRAGYSQKDVYEMFNIRQSTFSAWETGRAEPSADMLLKLCQLYNINDILGAFGFDGYNEDGSIRLNINEIDVIEKYRALNTSGREHVDAVLQWETNHMEELKAASTPAAIIEFQSPAGQANRLVEYFRSASAGGGVFILGNEADEQIEIPDTPENQSVDFAIKVSGDSMSPDYLDGDVALVSQKAELSVGDVGIFIINSNAYIKEYGADELISRNPHSPNIQIKEYDNIVCMGKVIGKL